MDFFLVSSFCPWNFSLGLLGWREKRGSVEYRIPVPTGTTSGAQGAVEEGSGCKKGHMVKIESIVERKSTHIKN